MLFNPCAPCCICPEVGHTVYGVIYITDGRAFKQLGTQPLISTAGDNLPLGDWSSLTEYVNARTYVPTGTLVTFTRGADGWEGSFIRGDAEQVDLLVKIEEKLDGLVTRNAWSVRNVTPGSSNGYAFSLMGVNTTYGDNVFGTTALTVFKYGCTCGMVALDSNFFDLPSGATTYKAFIVLSNQPVEFGDFCPNQYLAVTGETGPLYGGAFYEPTQLVAEGDDWTGYHNEQCSHEHNIRVPGLGHGFFDADTTLTWLSVWPTVDPIALTGGYQRNSQVAVLGKVGACGLVGLANAGTYENGDFSLYPGICASASTLTSDSGTTITVSATHLTNEGSRTVGEFVASPAEVEYPVCCPDIPETLDVYKIRVTSFTPFPSEDATLSADYLEYLKGSGGTWQLTLNGDGDYEGTVDGDFVTVKCEPSLNRWYVFGEAWINIEAAGSLCLGNNSASEAHYFSNCNPTAWTLRKVADAHPVPTKYYLVRDPAAGVIVKQLTGDRDCPRPYAEQLHLTITASGASNAFALQGRDEVVLEFGNPYSLYWKDTGSPQIGSSGWVLIEEDTNLPYVISLNPGLLDTVFDSSTIVLTGTPNYTDDINLFRTVESTLFNINGTTISTFISNGTVSSSCEPFHLSQVTRQVVYYSLRTTSTWFGNDAGAEAVVNGLRALDGVTINDNFLGWFVQPGTGQLDVGLSIEHDDLYTFDVTE